MEPKHDSFEIVDESPEETGKPKRKRKSKTRVTGIPWPWVLGAFVGGAGLVAVLALVVMIARVETTTPQAVNPSPPAPQPTPTFAILPSPQAVGDRVEAVAWRGDLMAAALPTRAGLYHRELSWIGDMNAYPFENLTRGSTIEMAIRPDETQLAAISTTYWFENGSLVPASYVKIWNLNASGGSLTQEFMAHSGNDGGFEGPYLDAALAFSPDNHLLATGAGRGEIRLWDATAAYQPIGDSIFTWGTGTVALAFSADSQRLAAIIRRDNNDATTNCLDCGEIQVWDISDPLKPFQLQRMTLQWQVGLEAALSPDGRYAAFAELADVGVCCVARSISIYDLAAFRPELAVVVPANTVVSELTFSDNGDTLAFVQRDPTPVDVPYDPNALRTEIRVVGVRPGLPAQEIEIALKAGLNGFGVSHLYVDASGEWVQYILNTTNAAERWYLQPNVTQNMSL